MTTINKVLSSIDALKPNAFTPEQKSAWLIDLDAQINTEIVKRTDYAEPEADANLLVPSPYDAVYGLYIEAQIAKYQQDPDYNNAATAFNAAYDAFVKSWNRTNLPAQPNSIINLW